MVSFFDGFKPNIAGSTPQYIPCLLGESGLLLLENFLDETSTDQSIFFESIHWTPDDKWYPNCPFYESDMVNTVGYINIVICISTYIYVYIYIYTYIYIHINMFGSMVVFILYIPMMSPNITPGCPHNVIGYYIYIIVYAIYIHIHIHTYAFTYMYICTYINI